MTKIDDNTWTTDLNDEIANSHLTDQGFSIRHIETWERDGYSDNIIVWDSPTISETDLPY